MKAVLIAMSICIGLSPQVVAGEPEVSVRAEVINEPLLIGESAHLRVTCSTPKDRALMLIKKERLPYRHAFGVLLRDNQGDIVEPVSQNEAPLEELASDFVEVGAGRTMSYEFWVTGIPRRAGEYKIDFTINPTGEKGTKQKLTVPVKYSDIEPRNIVHEVRIKPSASPSSQDELRLMNVRIDETYHLVSSWANSKMVVTFRLAELNAASRIIATEKAQTGPARAVEVWCAFTKGDNIYLMKLTEYGELLEHARAVTK